jgi:hypothetical protein
MFIKEMENAEIKKKYWLRNYLIGLFGSTFLLDTFLNTKDPKEVNEFVISIMNPFKKDDVDIKIKTQLNIIKEKEANTEKRYKELKKIKQNLDRMTVKNFKITTELINENINLSKNIYDKIEQGMVCQNNYPNPKNNGIRNRIISLFDIGHSEKNIEKEYNIDYNTNVNNNNNYRDVFENQSYCNRKNSDSDFSDMDINVETKV